MSQQGGPQGPNYDQGMNHQPAPSAYSAPQPGQPGMQPGQPPLGQPHPYGHGYGQPSGYGAPHQPSGFVSLFSTSFPHRGPQSLLSIVMLLGIVAFGIFGGYALFDLLTILTADYGPSAMGIVTSILRFAFRVAIGLVLLGLLRVILEHVARTDKKAD
ncbi:hypothetical protein EJO69_03765 [Flaviflexus salsibiostraticola]|uniref:DUF4282 domain-containing protein n=1 Tax=Flaviflexus salsibiostraticola TaxID=1282737 RepID=A0A3Q8WT14_9ACTO|nr:hypothetical protein [Flaviflexus salsibiostraticola]AZN29522.1 hypothetical protein EJO69_03765 [Flaviflexus salsibiostraticola]